MIFPDALEPLEAYRTSQTVEFEEPGTDQTVAASPAGDSGAVRFDELRIGELPEAQVTGALDY